MLNARNCGNLLSKRSCEELKIVEVCANINYISGDTNTSISGKGVSCSLNNNILDQIKSNQIITSSQFIS